VYAWQLGGRFTSFTSTNVQIPTPEELLCRVWRALAAGLLTKVLAGLLTKVLAGTASGFEALFPGKAAPQVSVFVRLY
jgi:hypothetical protein